MRRPTARVLAVAAASAGVLPTLLLLVASRAEAAPVFSQYALTSVVRASSTSGDVGATGGFTPLDSGSASIDASLDNSPTAMVLARPVEPGTTFATVNSQDPTHSFVVPEAAAAYPGKMLHATTAPVPTSTADATVTATTAAGHASTAGGTASLLSLGATTAATSLAAPGGGTSATATADAYASGFDAGVLSVHGVRGTAQVGSVAGRKRTATASLAIGSITVAGQAVTVDDTGVHAAGSTLPLGPTLDQLTATANSALSAAGISVTLARPVHTVTSSAAGGTATADSGGLQITVVTPDTTSVAGNTATVTLGRVQLNEFDAAPAVEVAPAPVSSAPPVSAAPAVPGTQGVPGSPGQTITVPGQPGTVPAPVAAAATPPATSHAVRLGPVTLSSRTALAALGGWQALTLSTATFAVLALRGTADDDEPELCPCPA